MTSDHRALAKRYRFNERVVHACTEGFEPADWARKPSPQGGNTAHWLLGHVTQARRLVLRRLGESIPREPWEELVGMKSKPEGTQGFEPVERLRAEFIRAGEVLERKLTKLTPNKADADWGAKFPDGSR